LKKKKKEINSSKIYSPVGNLAELKGVLLPCDVWWAIQLSLNYVFIAKFGGKNNIN